MKKDLPAARLSSLFEQLGIENDGDSCAVIGKAITSETQRLEERHGKRLGKLEEQMNLTRVDIAETQGRIDNTRTEIEGNVRLILEKLSSLDEKVERIESNTLRDRNAKRTWMIAVFAALPGLASMILRVIEMLGK